MIEKRSEIKRCGARKVEKVKKHPNGGGSHLVRTGEFVDRRVCSNNEHGFGFITKTPDIAAMTIMHGATKELVSGYFGVTALQSTSKQKLP